MPLAMTIALGEIAIELEGNEGNGRERYGKHRLKTLAETQRHCPRESLTQTAVKREIPHIRHNVLPYVTQKTRHLRYCVPV